LAFRPSPRDSSAFPAGGARVLSQQQAQVTFNGRSTRTLTLKGLRQQASKGEATRDPYALVLLAPASG
jgi:hypothetical protein